MKQFLFAVALLLIAVIFCVRTCTRRSLSLAHQADTSIAHRILSTTFQETTSKPKKVLLKTKTPVQPKQKEIDPAGLTVDVPMNDSVFNSMILYINTHGIYEGNFVHTYTFVDKDKNVHIFICPITLDSLGSIPPNNEDILVDATTAQKKRFLYVIKRTSALLCTNINSIHSKIIQNAMNDFIAVVQQ